MKIKLFCNTLGANPHLLNRNELIECAQKLDVNLSDEYLNENYKEE